MVARNSKQSETEFAGTLPVQRKNISPYGLARNMYNVFANGSTKGVGSYVKNETLDDKTMSIV